MRKTSCLRRLSVVSAVLSLVLLACTNPMISAPEIVLKQGANGIINGGSFAFGYVTVGVPKDTVFTIENSGAGTLLLSGTPVVAVSGADAALFSVSAQPAATIEAGKTAAFTLRFSPTAAGAKSATVSIATNDSDENPFTFTVTATGTLKPTATITSSDASRRVQSEFPLP